MVRKVSSILFSPILRTKNPSVDFWFVRENSVHLAANTANVVVFAV